MARAPEGPPPPPVVQRLRIRYAKRGRLRFTSHRDFQRALERALRRARVPIAFSAGFTPHPKVSYAGAAPTGVASEAEYLEIGLAEHRDPVDVRAALDAALPDGLDVLEVAAAGPGSLPDRLEASLWEIRLAAEADAVRSAVAALLAADSIEVERMTKNGRRVLDARAAVVGASVTEQTAPEDPCAIIRVVVRHVTPAVRPDDVLAALRQVAALAPSAPPLVTRLAQGPLEVDGRIADPFDTDRVPVDRPPPGPDGAQDAAGTAP